LAKPSAGDRVRANRIRTAALIVQLSLCVFHFSSLRPLSAAETFPYRQEPINYFADDLGDPVSELRRKLESGTSRLQFEPPNQGGYLRSLLAALEISPMSQMLVFAKNSVHARLINPENPRALYFNDTVYVGFVPGAPFLEISSVDPKKGAIFYTLAQKADGPPALAREESCLLCHASSNALNVPGHLVRSFLTDPQGNPGRGHSRITHNSPYVQRWGGFYVTGDWGELPHLGNLATAADLLEYERHRDGPGKAVDLTRRIDRTKYLTLHSDIVALLVHEHQTHGHNLITRVRYEHAFQKSEDPSRNSEEDLVRYVLFADEPPLENPVLGSTAYETWFAKQGPRDNQGRSLRQLDLETRLLRYRLSYLIYSDAFANLPEPVRLRIYRRLWEILSTDTPEPPFDKLPRSERMAILEIIRATKTNLPDYWQVPQP
jgi:hypothetical protein